MSVLTHSDQVFLGLPLLLALERKSNSFQSTRPVGVLFEELLVVSSFTLNSEGDTSIF